MDRFQCDFYAHGDDAALNKDGVNAAQDIIDAGRYKEFKRTKGVSTTNIVGRLLMNIHSDGDLQEQVKQPVKSSDVSTAMRRRRNSVSEEETKDDTIE